MTKRKRLAAALALATGLIATTPGLVYLGTISVGVLGLAISAPATAEPKWPPCRCVNYGRYMLVGEVGCIKTNKGPRMARCILKGNVTYWEWLSDSCPVSKATPVSIPPALT